MILNRKFRAIGEIALLLGSIGASPAPPATRAVSFDDGYRLRLGDAAPDVSFKLGLKSSAVQFHLGQAIPLLLQFSCPVLGKYKLNGQLYDRSGRLNQDMYCLDRTDGAADPMADYFSASGYYGGGLAQLPQLTEKTQEFSFDLNEWQRIDKPGKYRLYSQSFRILTPDGQMLVKDHLAIGAVSNIVEFEILPRDKAWESQQLRETVATLEAPNTNADSRLRAWRSIDYLGTEDAAEILVAHFGLDQTDDNAIFFGLFSNPHRDKILPAMEDIIDDKDRPVTQLLLTGLVRMRMAAWQKELGRTNPATTQPVHFGPTPEAMKQELSIRVDLARRLAASMPNRKGRIKDISAETLENWRTANQ